MCQFTASATVAYTGAYMEETMCNMITLRFAISPITEAFARSDLVWHDFFVPNNASLMTIDNSLSNYLNG